MPSPFNSPSRFRSRTRSVSRIDIVASSQRLGRVLCAILALMAPATLGCSSDDDASCGPGDLEGGALSLATATSGPALTFAELHAGANNDCPLSEAAPTSISIQGQQTNAGATGFLTLCLPLPADVTPTPISFDDTDHIVIFDFRGQDADGCTLRVDRQGDLSSGLVSIEGFCDNGTHPSGFAISLSGTLPFVRTCPSEGGPDTETDELGTLAGDAVVVAD